MRTAVDTNIFSVLLSGGEEVVSIMQAALEEASAAGTIVVSPVVYAELAAGRTTGFVDDFFSEKHIEVDWDLGSEVWRTAGSRYGAYAGARRRQKNDPGPRRILADFLIGAHALHFAQALLTSDARIYGSYFSELRVLAPEGSTGGSGG